MTFEVFTLVMNACLCVALVGVTVMAVFFLLYAGIRSILSALNMDD